MPLCVALMYPVKDLNLVSPLLTKMTDSHHYFWYAKASGKIWKKKDEYCYYQKA